MGNFKQGGGGFKRNDRGGGGFKPNFQKKSWGGDRGGDREVTMHQARCSNCGKDCEVPFRPTQGKPVFCKECFSKEAHGGDDRAPRRDFDSRNDRPRREFEPRRHDGARPDFRAERPENSNNDLKKQLEMLTVKLDRLIQSVENLNRTKPMLPKEVAAEAPKADEKKKSIEASLKGDKLIKAVSKKTSKKGPIKK